MLIKQRIVETQKAAVVTDLIKLIQKDDLINTRPWQTSGLRR